LESINVTLTPIILYSGNCKKPKEIDTQLNTPLLARTDCWFTMSNPALTILLPYQDSLSLTYLMRQP
jgi:hypothetical protein